MAGEGQEYKELGAYMFGDEYGCPHMKQIPLEEQRHRKYGQGQCTYSHDVTR